MGRWIVLILALAPVLGAARAQVPDRKPFRHSDHVYAKWDVDNEQPRDCRGCHQFRRDNSVEGLPSPSELCAHCHAPDGASESSPRFDLQSARVNLRDESESMFKHGSHAELKCAQCHYEPKGDTFEILPSGAGGAALAECIRCHETKDREAFNEGMTEIAELHRQRQSAYPRFRHDTHMTPEQRADPQICLECHSSVVDAERDRLGEPQFDTRKCAACHVGMRFEAVTTRADGKQVEKPSAAAGAFDHAPHLQARRGSTPSTKVDAAAFDVLAAQSCLACHAWNEDAAGVPTFGLGPRFSVADVHDACVSCHTPWRSTTSRHGTVDHCVKCHRIEPGLMTNSAAQRSNRPTIEIRRFDPAAFQFDTQAHVLIHGQRGAQSDDCARCHRAEIERSASRIGTKPFSHATHVDLSKVGLSKTGPAPGASVSGTCRECHFTRQTPISLADADMPSDSDGTRAVSVSYEPSTCTPCHGEGSAEPSFEVAPRLTSLVFSHDDHFNRRMPGAEGRNMECVDCHVTSAPDQPLVLTLADKVADCTQCHGHVEHPRKAPPKGTKQEIEGCVNCHRVGVPAKDQPVSVFRSALRLDTDSFQVHSGEARCTSCHRVVDPPKPAATADNGRGAEERIEVALVGQPDPSRQGAFEFNSPHNARTASNRKARDTGTAKDVALAGEASCYDCHWHNIYGDLARGKLRPTSDKTMFTKERRRRSNGRPVPAHLSAFVDRDTGPDGEFLFNDYEYRAAFGGWIGEEYRGTFPGIPPAK